MRIKDAFTEENILIVLFTLGLMIGFHVIKDAVTHYTSTAHCKVENGRYQVKEPDDVWATIMLPHTQLGLTAFDLTTGVEKYTSKGKKGRPSVIADFDQKYMENVKITRWQQVQDGNYCVERIRPEYIDDDPPWSDPMWTVWTKALFNAVQKAKEIK